ncbi:molybdate ABC transporter substrate-binding protein [Arthrobacter sp. 92]|uniref:molybdate ABC transporter substrate-binding protein n=1 Tax=Arthrobacter sp. 92 TaxID=3418175 RepID=UPI003D042E8D
MRAGKACALLLAASLAAGVSGCSAGPAGPAGPASSAGPAGSAGSTSASGTITVFAAASLKGTFTQLAQRFEAENPGTKVALSFAGSSDLVTQITQGAPADVLATADTSTMARLADAGLLDGSATTFATNVLEIAVAPANPASIKSFNDLARPGLRVVACAHQVPCGAAAEAVEKTAGTSLRPVSEESSVTDVLGKVVSGEADAGLVYRTDVRSAGAKVQGVPFPEASRAVNSYPIATVASSRAKTLAAAFITLVTGSEGKKTLTDAGFGTPQP